MGGTRTPDVSSISKDSVTFNTENEYINIPVVEEVIETAPKLATAALTAITPTVNKAVVNERRTIADFMTEGGFVGTTAAITTTSTVATITVSITSPPKPVFIKIMAGGIGGTILGGIVAALILRHYRKQVLKSDAISTSTTKSKLSK
ncbi:MAG: hypothetical protein AAF349_24245 [Cyanobacteria bacterium P01_A01_bin.68]